MLSVPLESTTSYNKQRCLFRCFSYVLKLTIRRCDHYVQGKMRVRLLKRQQPFINFVPPLSVSYKCDFCHMERMCFTPSSSSDARFRFSIFLKSLFTSSYS